MPRFLSSQKPARYLAFGWVLAGFSTIGTGYFVGLFNPYLRQDFDLTNADVIFTMTTLASAPAMFWLGGLIDTMDLGHYVVLVDAGLSTGCVLIGCPTPFSPWRREYFLSGGGVALAPRGNHKFPSLLQDEQRESYRCRLALKWVLPQFVWSGSSIRALSSSGPARPYIARLRVLSRLI